MTSRVCLSLVALLCAVLPLSAFRMMQSPLSITNKLSNQQGLNMMFNFNSGKASSSFPTNKKLCVITGTSSGLGKETAKALIKGNEEYFVVCAVRDVDKMKAIAEKEKFDPSRYAIMDLDLSSFDSVKRFANDLKKRKSKPLERLVCNAAVYQPALPTVSLSVFVFAQ